MKLQRALVENFKGVRRCEIDFQTDPTAEPRWLTALTGDNGSGKTTVLQAIALTLSVATCRTRQPEGLRWHGFLAERLSTLGPARVELQVLFEPGEIESVQALYQQWLETRDPAWLQEHGVVVPSTLSAVKLVYEGGRVLAPQGAAAYFQFRGRSYIKTLLGTRPQVRSYFNQVGDIFWFDQLRNLGSRAPEDRRPTGRALDRDDSPPEESWTAGVEQLREDLVGWWGYHTSPMRDKERDFLEKLEQHFNVLFPGTRFAGIAPRDAVSTLRRPEFYFLFERGGRTYDLAELSSGEQAAFPLLSEFVRLGITRSIVLIDELELHLHPPQQQALLGALRKLGPDCQFIITTHSPYLSEVLPSEEIVHLEGGRRCL